MPNILELENVTKTYHPPGRDKVVALNGVSLQVEPGAFKVVTGHSGSGKTTLLLAAGGLLRPDPGTIRVDGEDLYRLNAEERARFRAANIGFVFQQFHLISFLTVLENILAPTLAVTGHQAEERARALADEFGLSHRLDHPPSELSTGERQRVAMARALLNEPAVVLADEPTGNLDESNSTLVLKHLRDYADRGGAVLMATHDSRIEADEKYALKDGSLVDHAFATALQEEKES